MHVKFLETLDWSILIAYFLILIAIGIWASSKRKKGSSLFLAENSLRWYHIGFSMWGTNVGPSMLIASASAGFTTGIVSGNYAWYAFVFICLLAFVFAPRYLGSRITTLPEFMGKRFGQSTRNILAWYTIITILISWLALTLFAGGVLIRQVFDIPMWQSALLLLVISAFFTMLGGLKAVAYTNVYQMILLIVVSATLAIMGIYKVGGEKDWLFSAKPDAPDALLSTQEPALWEKIQASSSGQFEYRGECHYYAWYQFKQQQWQAERWLVAQRSAGQACGHLTASAVKTWATQLVVMSTFTVPLLVLWLLSRWNARELRRGLRETNVQLELITSEADVALLMVDHECRVCWINPESERLLGWKTDELVGANLHERTHMWNGEDLHSGSCPTLQSLQTGQRYRNDRDRVLAKSGEILNVSMRVSPFGEGEARKAIVTIADVGDAVDREQRLTRLATTDPLTGALNRRSIMERLQDMVEHQKMPPCVLMGDIDFFKKVNDTYGHAAGDEVLKTFTNTIRQLLRKGDFLGRLGGEEFVVALENTDLPNAQTMAERLRLAIANSQTPNDGGIPIAITASFGLALYSRDESVDAWLARADAALYRAKQSGRNRVEIA
jgi:diguanylate cyclase (GGDEF)-like protein/PAS domain S-box-containing protein